MYISKRLKELRTVSGFSQEKLAERLDVSRQTISSWENERSYPDVHNLIMLCDIYSVSLDDLMKGDIETMKKEVANTTLNKSPQDAIQLIQSGLVMIIGPVSYTHLAGTLQRLLYFGRVVTHHAGKYI